MNRLKNSKLSEYKKKRLLMLTNKQKEEIWGESGPYSEAYLIFETRILDDEISRIFIEVEASINPLTYKLIKKHIDQFDNDLRVKNIIEYAEYRDRDHGYISYLFSAPYESSLLETANKILRETEEAIIRMHKFVLNYYDINTN
jgi:hypothetical protein